MTENKPPDHDAAKDQDPVLELNFVPEWARRPAGENPYGAYDAGREPRRQRSSRGRDGRRDRSARPGKRPERSARRPSAPVRDRRREQSREPRPPPLPVRISFLPERRHLGSVVSRIRRTGRAYPLADLAGLFLQDAQGYRIKVEPARRAPPDFRLFQCGRCKAVFADREEAVRHAVTSHWQDRFEVSEVDVEPPSGHFICIGRCTLNGELLGPPNYHDFDEALRSLHQRRYADMPFEQFRSKVENVHDEALIEQWKQSRSRQQRYRARGEDEQPFELAWSEVETRMQREADADISSGRRFVMPGPAAAALPAGSLRVAISRAWHHESRFPSSLMFALRPAFRHMHLHVFKTRGNIQFVTATHPRPVDPAKTIPAIRHVLEYLAEHPGCPRKELETYLRERAGSDTDPEEALQDLHWLAERGHVIEFFNGTLSVPTAGRKA